MLLTLALVLASCPPAVVAPSPAPLYPIDPVGLRSLLRAADLVVVAEVSSESEPSQMVAAGFADSVARLRVTRSLEGAAPVGSVVRVLYSPTMICPSPASYPAGETVLAFLYRWEDDPADHYRTVALSYGSKSLSPEALAVYLARIRELQALPDPEQPEARRAALAEWITRVLEQPATREEGLIDLERDRAFVREQGELPLSIELLDELQTSRLLDALEVDATGDYTWARLLKQLADVRDPRLDRILVAKLWGLSGQRQSSAQSEVMRVLARRLDDDGLRALVKEIGALRGPWEEVAAQRHRIVTVFLAECAERHPFLTER